MSNIKEIKRVYRHRRIRKQMVGTPERPRLCFHRSLKNVSASIIDDTSGKVLMGMSTLSKDLRAKLKSGGNIIAAGVFGEVFGKEAIAKGYRKVAFDRGEGLHLKSFSPLH